MQSGFDLKTVAVKATQGLSYEQVLEVLPKPAIILSPPRSGSTLLFEQLAKLDHYWTIGGESHNVFREFQHLRAKNEALDSMALSREHADEETCDLFRRCFLVLLRNNKGVPFLRMSPEERSKIPYFLEKTPRNALNIPFLRSVFPNAHYIYLQRDFQQTISSLIEAWTLGLETGRFVTFPNLPDWPLQRWCFLLPDGWREMRGKSLAEIAAFQWMASNNAIMEGLSDLPKNQWAQVSFTDLINNRTKLMDTLNTTFNWPTTAPELLAAPLPISRSTISPPSPDKWKRHKKEIDALRPFLENTEKKINGFCMALK